MKVLEVIGLATAIADCASFVPLCGFQALQFVRQPYR